MLMRCWLLAFPFFLVVVPVGSAQTPLPATHQVYGFDHSNADVFFPPVSQPGSDIWAIVEFVNAGVEPRVEIRWRFKTESGGSKSTTSHDVSFLPTSVTAKAGTTTTLYVVGWLERASKVIVEEWVLDDLALLETPSPTGTGSLVALTGPSVDRTLIAALDGLSPVYCAAVHPVSNIMYLLDSATPRAIHGLDLETGSLLPQPLVTEAEQPALAAQRALVLAKHSGTSGYVMFTSTIPRWANPSSSDSSAPVLVFDDADEDGVFSPPQVMSMAAFNASTSTDPRFPEPD